MEEAALTCLAQQLPIAVRVERLPGVGVIVGFLLIRIEGFGVYYTVMI